jgi:hypothetical protein
VIRAGGLALAWLLLGCHASDGPPAPSGSACAEGFVSEGALCVPRFDPCEEGQLPTFGGGCLPIGATCGEGFASDGKGSCAPVLPETDCPDGQTAIPGDSACRPVDECGTGTFGDIPDEPRTMHVDQAAAEGGDGTRIKPFRTIAEALDVTAVPVSTIAIAAGTYTCNALIRRALVVRGRCASMVNLEGSADLPAMQTLQLLGDVTVQGVSITGPYIGVGVYQGNVTLDHVRVHDTGFTAIEALSYGTRTKLAIRDSLLERGTQTALLIAGADVAVERSVLRATRMRSGKTGSGAIVRERKDVDSGVTHPGALAITRSVVSKVRQNGILVSGATLDAEGLVVRGTRPDDANSGGPGVAAQTFEGHGSKIAVRHSFLSDNVRTQLSVIGGEAIVEHTVAAHGVSEKNGRNGGGFFFGGGATYTLADSVAEKNRAFGVVAEEGVGTVARVLVRDIATSPDGIGLGIQVAFDEASFAIGHMSLDRVRIDRCPQVGFLVFGAEASASELAVFDTEPLEGVFGDAIALNTAGPAEAPIVAKLSLERSVVRRAARAGITVFGAELTVRSSQLGCSPIDVAIESSYSTLSSHEPRLDADDSSTCGCESSTTCHAQSAGLAPVAH